MPTIKQQLVCIEAGPHGRQPFSNGGNIFTPLYSPTGPTLAPDATPLSIAINTALMGPINYNGNSSGLPAGTYTFLFVSVTGGTLPGYTWSDPNILPPHGLGFAAGGDQVVITYVYVEPGSGTIGSGDYGATINAFNEATGGVLIDPTLTPAPSGPDFVTVIPASEKASGNQEGWVDTTLDPATINALPIVSHPPLNFDLWQPAGNGAELSVAQMTSPVALAMYKTPALAPPAVTPKSPSEEGISFGIVSGIPPMEFPRNISSPFLLTVSGPTQSTGAAQTGLEVTIPEIISKTNPQLVPNQSWNYGPYLLPMSERGGSPRLTLACFFIISFMESPSSTITDRKILVADAVGSATDIIPQNFVQIYPLKTGTAWQLRNQLWFTLAFPCWGLLTEGVGPDPGSVPPDDAVETNVWVSLASFPRTFWKNDNELDYDQFSAADVAGLNLQVMTVDQFNNVKLTTLANPPKNMTLNKVLPDSAPLVGSPAQQWQTFVTVTL